MESGKSGNKIGKTVLTAILLIIPYLILTFGIGLYDKNIVLWGMSFFAWFLVIMDIFAVLLTYAAYRLGKNKEQKVKQQT